MKIVLHSVAKRDDGGLDLLVSQGGNEPVRYGASFFEKDRAWCCGVDEELFHLLSNAACKRFGNCVVYQMELSAIVRAFSRGDEIPSLPAELGTTTFCAVKPSFLRIWWNKARRLALKLAVCRPRIKVLDPSP